jgi:hypothetical protein
VTVERLTPSADGVGDDYTTIVELLAEADILSRFAPTAVAEALGADDNDEAPRMAMSGSAPAGNGGEPKTKRPRRTKQQIAADEAAAMAAEAAQYAPDTSADGAAPVAPPVAPANQTPALDTPPTAAAPAFNPFATPPAQI